MKKKIVISIIFGALLITIPQVMAHGGPGGPGGGHMGAPGGHMGGPRGGGYMGPGPMRGPGSTRYNRTHVNFYYGGGYYGRNYYAPGYYYGYNNCLYPCTTCPMYPPVVYGYGPGVNLGFNLSI